MAELYLYCVTRAQQAPPVGLTGLADAPVFAVADAGLAVWVSTAGAGVLQAGIEAIQRHNDVVETAVSDAVTPIPLRFGQRLSDEAEVRARIEIERERWLEQLALFAGALEFGVRVLDPLREGPARDVHDAPASGGRAYLEQLAKRHAGEREAREEAERVAEQLRSVVGDTPLRERVEPLRSARGIASIAHLVPRARFGQYRERIGAARAALPCVRLLVSGPWPPYSFAT